MINGFRLTIKNSSSDLQIVTLFKMGIENSYVYIHSLNSNYNYNSLLLMANSKGFIGSGFESESVFIKKVTICKPNLVKKIELKTIWNEEEIYIDGFSNYIIIEVPPMMTGSFNLTQVKGMKMG